MALRTNSVGYPLLYTVTDTLTRSILDPPSLTTVLLFKLFSSLFPAHILFILLQFNVTLQTSQIRSLILQKPTAPTISIRKRLASYGQLQS